MVDEFDGSGEAEGVDVAGRAEGAAGADVRTRATGRARDGRARSRTVRIGLLLVLSLLLAACGGSTDEPAQSGGATTATTAATAATDSPGTSRSAEVTFTSGDREVPGTLLLPGPADAGPYPAALLIQGSGPTDRDGNTPAVSGEIDTMENLAGVLRDAGVASLRYDKLGSGSAALGGIDPAEVGFTTFLQEAADAMAWLRGAEGVDPERLMLLGHSEGGLVALELLDEGLVEDVQALALFAPVPGRYLDVLRRQILDGLDNAVETGALERQEADATVAETDRAIRSLREDGTVPDVQDPSLQRIFLPGNARFLAEADAADPVAAAADLPDDLPTLLVCARSDVQVPCDTLDELRAALAARPGDVTRSVELEGVNHVLKEVGDRQSTGVEYGEDLPFSSEGAQVLTEFVDARMTPGS